MKLAVATSRRTSGVGVISIVWELINCGALMDFDQSEMWIK